MRSSPLDNLVCIGQLKAEPPAQAEFDGLIRSGCVRLEDAQNVSLSLESRFDLAYNAADALSLAALRWHGYRSENTIRSSSACPTRWRLKRPCGESSIKPIENATSPNTKATSMSTSPWWTP